MHIDAIKERFARPPAEYSPTPFWFLNDNLDQEQISRTLEELKDKGIFGVILHPRTGLEIPYLSDLYWERMLFICETLKRLHMTGWIYDEYNWPSGPVGGRLLREHPEFKQVGLDYRTVSSSRLEKELQNLPGLPYAAYEVSSHEVIDKTDSLRGNKFRDFSGDVLLFLLREVQTVTHATCCAPWAKGEAGYLDVLNSAAVDEFMRMTHLEYDRRIRRYYGETIVGVFTDEPGNYFALPYSRVLPAEYQERYKEDLRTCLPSLAAMAPGIAIERQILHRTRYFSLARDLYVDGFFNKMATWASERGLEFTGHLNDDDMIHRLPSVSASFFGPLSRMSMPGIDVLEDRHGFEADRRLLKHANFAPKAASSIAHHFGRKRTLCEIWGGNGWATPPERLKASLNWAQACGINFINPHAVFMSLCGLRKRDFPASHFPPQPWWRFYKRFSDYISRVSFLNSQGKHLADILFVFPQKSLWADFDLKAKENRLADVIERASEGLLRNQLDFDYLFDEFLDTSEVTLKDRRISVGEESYSVLLLPLHVVVPEKVLDLAEKFAAQGGRVIGFGYQMPAHDEYGHEVSDRLEALFGGNKPENVEFYHLGTEGDSNFTWLTKKVKEWARADLVVKGDLARHFAYLHRKMDGADCYFIANLSEKEDTVDLVFRCSGNPEYWNPEAGSIQNVFAYRTDKIHTYINRYFRPNEAIFVVFTEDSPAEHVDSGNLTLTSVTPEYAEGYASALEIRITLEGKQYTRSVEKAFQPLLLPRRWKIDYPVQNILLLDEWEIEILTECPQEEWSPRGDPRLGVRPKLILEGLRQMARFAKAFRKRGGNTKAPTTKYQRLSQAVDSAEKWSKILGIDPQDFDEAEGILLKMAEYAGMPVGYDYPPPGCAFAMTSSFFIEHLPAELALVYEEVGGGPLSIQLNGHEIDKQPERVFIWDHSNRSVKISTLVRKGENRLRLEWRQPSFPTLFPSVHGIEPVCLTGPFWVKKKRIVEQQYGALPIPWGDIGLPNYIGALTYRTSFKLPLKYVGQQLLMKFNDVKVAAEVKINGKYVGALLWRPYALDVTNFLVQGENQVEVTVANTAANLLAEPVAAGLIGKTYIVPYWRHRVRFAR